MTAQPRPVAPWIVATDRPLGFRCLRCDEVVTWQGPVSMRWYLARADQFMAAHQDCPPWEERYGAELTDAAREALDPALDGLLRCAACGEIAMVVDRCEARPRPWCLAHSYGFETVDPTLQVNLTADTREALIQRALTIPRTRGRRAETDGD